MEKWTDSIDCCRNALLINVNSVKALYRRALALKNKGRLKMALKDVNFAIELDPNNTDL